MDDVIAELTKIVRGDPWAVRPALTAYLEELKRERVPGAVRTGQQNRALHKWFDLVAIALNDGGYTVQLVLKEKVDLEWDAMKVKELLWRPAQRAIVDKASTRELKKTGDIDEVWEHLNKHLGEKFGVHVPFPSYEIPYDEAPLKGDA